MTERGEAWPGRESAALGSRTALGTVLMTVLCLAWAGCASSGGPFREHYAAGRLEAAAEAFEADSSLHDEAGALYRAGLLYGTPGSPVYDPARAAEQLGRLLELHPEADRARGARTVLRLLTRADSLARQLERLKAVDLGGQPPDTTLRF